MNGEALRRIVVIRNPNGFHVRPAAAFAEAAGRFASTVILRHQDKAVDGRRILDLLMLAAAPGAEVTIEVSGPDAADALDVLAGVLGAEEPPLPGPSLPPKG